MRSGYCRMPWFPLYCVEERVHRSCLLGEAYLHGFMHGEMIKELEGSLGDVLIS